MSQTPTPPTASAAFRRSAQVGEDWVTAEMAVTVPLDERGQADPDVIANAVLSADLICAEVRAKVEAGLQEKIAAHRLNSLKQQLAAALASLGVPSSDAAAALEVLGVRGPVTAREAEQVLAKVKELLKTRSWPEGWRWEAPRKSSRGAKPTTSQPREPQSSGDGEGQPAGGTPVPATEPEPFPF